MQAEIYSLKFTKTYLLGQKQSHTTTVMKSVNDAMTDAMVFAYFKITQNLMINMEANKKKIQK